MPIRTTVKIKAQELDAVVFDGTMKLMNEIIEKISDFPHSSMIKANVEIDEDMTDLVIHLYVVNSSNVLFSPQGSPIGLLYFQIGAGDVIVFAGEVITVINHKLIEPLGVMIDEKQFTTREEQNMKSDGYNDEGDFDDDDRFFDNLADKTFEGEKIKGE